MGGRELPIGMVGRRFAETVAQCRRAQGLTRAEVAARMAAQGRDIGVRAVGRIETGDRRVDVDDLLALARAIGVPVSLGPNMVLIPPETAEDGPLPGTGDGPESSFIGRHMIEVDAEEADGPAFTPAVTPDETASLRRAVDELVNSITETVRRQVAEAMLAGLQYPAAGREPDDQPRADVVGRHDTSGGHDGER